MLWRCGSLITEICKIFSSPEPDVIGFPADPASKLGATPAAAGIPITGLFLKPRLTKKLPKISLK